MDAERPNPKARLPSGNQSIWERLSNGSGSPSPSPAIDSASSTPFNFGSGRASSASFPFQRQIPAWDANNSAGTVTAAVAKFMRTPTPSNSGPAQTGTSPPRASDDFHPDSPIPSVESDTSSINNAISVSRTISNRESLTNSTNAPRIPSIEAAVQHQSDRLRNLRLGSASDVGIARSSSTPLIRFTASDLANDSTQARAARSDSLVAGVSALHLASERGSTPDSSGRREEHSVSPSRGRGRSRSVIIEEIHQVEDEEPPESLRHAPEAQTTLTKAMDLASKMADILSSSNMHKDSESSIAKLHQQAEKLSAFALPSSRIVGLIGDSGVGKSSLINSLLDRIDLTRASGKGTACTCTVTEYIFHDRDDFIVEVEYFPIDELRKQFEELLSAYREYHSRPKDSRNNASSEQDDDREAERKNLKAKLALDTFKATFGDRLASTPTLLMSTPLEQAVRTMVDWAVSLIPSHTTRDTFTTSKACSTRLMQLTSESTQAGSSSRSSTCWPIIRKLRVYLKALILKKGLILADLPGLRDLNSTRRAITERHIRQCHQIFVVDRIERAITDVSIREAFELADQANLSNVDIICTKSEIIQVRETDDWPEEKIRINELSGRIEANEKELKTLNNQIKSYGRDPAVLNEEERLELLKLQSDRDKVQESKNSLDFELQHLIITTRNNTVCNGLQSEYGARPSGLAPKVFCVSNTMYWDKRNDAVSTALPYLKLSGILELRRYCIEIVGQSQLRATRDFIKEELPAFLGSVQLWIEAGSGNGNAERKQKTLDVVLAIECVLDMLVLGEPKLNNAYGALQDIFRTSVRTLMMQNGRKWKMNSRRASQTWNEYNPSTYKAFCSNLGSHKTQAIGSRCWNEEAMSSTKADLSPAWATLISSVDHYYGEMATAVNESFGKMLRSVVNSQLFDSRMSSNSAMRELAGVIRHKKMLVLRGLARANATLNKGLATLYTNTVSEMQTAFFAGLVDSAYRAANLEWGPGSDQRRKNLITSAFGSDSLFKDLEQKCWLQFMSIAQVYQERVNNIIEKQIELIEVSLQILRDGNVILESEKNPKFRRELEETLSKVKEDLDTLEQLFEDIG